MRNGLYMYFMGVSFIPPIMPGNKGHPQAAGPSAGAPAATLVGVWLHQVTYLPPELNIRPQRRTFSQHILQRGHPSQDTNRKAGVATTQTQHLLHPYVYISTTLQADSRGGNWDRSLQQTTRRTQLPRPAPPPLSNPKAQHAQQSWHPSVLIKVEKQVFRIDGRFTAAPLK